MGSSFLTSNKLRWLALACLVVPMFASYFFDDAFSSVSHIFKNPENLALGWNSKDFGDFIGDYSLLCVCGGLIVGGMLLDVFGTRIMGTCFLVMMILGGLAIWLGVCGIFPSGTAIVIGRIGRMFFGLGSEIAGVAVTRSIAKWFRDGGMSFAMGLQIGIARLGTALALILAPFIVGVPKDFYSISDTARPIAIGSILLVAGLAAWVAFCLIDRSSDAQNAAPVSKGNAASVSKGNAASVSNGKVETELKGQVRDEDKFSFKDILSLVKNPRFLLLGILCVTFYCCVSSFKKFGTIVVIPRFGIDETVAGTMISMIPFCTIVFTPLFGALVDRLGHAYRWMIAGSLTVLCGHLLIAFAPEGVAAFGYLGIAMLGLGYSLVPSAMWPTVPRIVPSKDLGTAFSLIYWIQNLGLLLVPKFIGRIALHGSEVEIAMNTEWLFIALGTCAVVVAISLNRVAKKSVTLQ